MWEASIVKPAKVTAYNNQDWLKSVLMHLSGNVSQSTVKSKDKAETPAKPVRKMIYLCRHCQS